MDTYARDRRQIYDLDYFANGGVERRTGPWDRRSGKDRRQATNPLDYAGPERRTAIDRRKGMDSR